VKNYFLKLSDREEGPLSEGQVSQLFADGRADRNTPCRVAPDGAWKTIDDLLPMLKYGTQLPPPTAVPVVKPIEPVAPAMGRREMPGPGTVKIIDIDLPFGSVFMLVLKGMIAMTIISIGLFIIWLVIGFLFLGGLLSHLR
jgi:hypothetical protein